MFKTTILLFVLALSGCANSSYTLAKLYDSNDICQQTQLVKTGQYPSWCGSTGTTYTTRDFTTGRYLTTTKVQK